MSKTIKPLIPQ